MTGLSARLVALSTPGRGMCAALGVNLWTIALLVPTVATRSTALLPLLVLGPVLLLFGVVTLSPPALLLGVPLAAVLPLGLPELARARQGAAPFGIVALALLAYLAVTLRLLARDGAVEIARAHALPLVQLPSRWRRRRLLFAALPAVTLAVPLGLLYVVDLHPTTRALLAQSYPHPEAAQSLLTAGVALLSALTLAHVVMRPLAGHLELDRAVLQSVARARRRRFTFWIQLCVGLSFVFGVALRLWLATRASP